MDVIPLLKHFLLFPTMPSHNFIRKKHPWLNLYINVRKIEGIIEMLHERSFLLAASEDLVQLWLGWNNYSPADRFFSFARVTVEVLCNLVMTANIKTQLEENEFTIVTGNIVNCLKETMKSRTLKIKTVLISRVRNLKTLSFFACLTCRFGCRCNHKASWQLQAAESVRQLSKQRQFKH